MRAQPYINYKEKKLAEEALKSCKQSNKASNDGHRSEEEKIKDLTLTPKDYTTLNASYETILLECYATKFRGAGIKTPNLLKESARTDKSKYCHYHRSWGNETEEYFQL
jgi:hypothetical protein